APGQVEDAREVGAHESLPVLVGELHDGCAALHAGVVDEDVWGSDQLLDLGHPGVDACGIRDVEGEACSLDARRPGDLAGRRGRLRGIPAVHHDARTGRGQPLRESPADSLAGAGDQRRATGEIERRDAVRRHLPTAVIETVVANTSSPPSLRDTLMASSMRVRSRRSVSGARNVDAVVIRASTPMYAASRIQLPPLTAIR